MHTPYTLNFADAFFAAQSCAGLMLTALIVFCRFGPWTARGAILIGVWLSVVAGTIEPSLVALGSKPGQDALRHVLAASALFGAFGSAVALRPGVTALALVGEVPLWLVDGFVQQSDAELCALHLAWLGLLIGLLARGRSRAYGDSTPPPWRAYRVHDGVVFVVATALAVIVSVAVMHKDIGSADEWAYTFQAAVFAKGRLYARTPECQTYLQSFYVFEQSGRLFSQYTPGWPMFMAPFVLVGVPWLAAPVATGFMAVGLARLGRSAARLSGDLPQRAVEAAGTWAAALATVGVTILVNGASRYPHVWVVALYAWSLEALVAVGAQNLPPAHHRLWALVLGSATAWMLATRPADGAFLGVGIALAFFYALVRGRVRWDALVVTTVSFAFWAGLVLIILRVQLGKWFTTGYSLNAVFHPWNVVKYSTPRPSEWKYGLPLATGSYCWWPCSVPFGVAGLALLRGRATPLVLALVIGCLAFMAFCTWLDTGQRGFDWGYGPRYLMPLVVPMAIGGGAALGPMTIAGARRWVGGRSALSMGGPIALATFAIVSGWVRVVPNVWPTVTSYLHRYSGLTSAIRAMHLKNAVVLAQPGTTGADPLDLPTNLPVDLYPNQDVIVAIHRSPDAVACMRHEFPGRKFYTAAGLDDVRVKPF